MVRLLFVGLVIVSVTLVPCQAQETRAAIVEKEQATKAQVGGAREPGIIEKLIGYLDRNDLIDRFSEGDGVFPFVGGITTGGGLGFGGGYRQHLFDYAGLFETSAAISMKGYKQIAAEFTMPRLSRDRLEVGGNFAYRSFPQEDFYGIGLSSAETDRVNYSLKGADTSGNIAFRPRPWFTVGTRVGYLKTRLGPGTDPKFPTVEDRFSVVTAPGLGAQVNYPYAEISADVDTRDEPGNPRSGTHHRVSWIRYPDGRFGFSRVNAEANHYVPIFDKKRVFLVRGLLTLSEPDAGKQVPFFMMPTLGGSHTLRSADDYRYRANNMLVLNAEYRWEAFSVLDMALFVDGGTVANTRSDLGLSDMKHAYGLGFRFNSAGDVFYRIDIARGEGGFHFLFKFSGPFKDRGAWPADTQAHRHRRFN